MLTLFILHKRDKVLDVGGRDFDSRGNHLGEVVIPPIDLELVRDNLIWKAIAPNDSVAVGATTSTCHNGVGWDIVCDDGACANHGTVANSDVLRKEAMSSDPDIMA